MQDKDWVKPGREALLAAVRDIVEYNPERHQQGLWVGNELGRVEALKVEEARGYIGTGIPETPANPARPVCGTTACVAGWIAIMAAPPGAIITNAYIQLPGKPASSISKFAREAAQLSEEQALWLFDGYRDRDEIVEALTVIIVDPAAAIYDGDHED